MKFTHRKVTPMKTKSASRNIQFIHLFVFNLIFHASQIFTAYKNVYLQDNGFTASQIGVGNALGYVTIFACTFASGLISDSLSSIKKVLLPVIVIGAGTYALTPAFSTTGRFFVPIMIIYLTLSSGFRDTAYSMVDNLLVRSSVDNQFNFGAIRGAGSVAYAVAGILCTAIIPKLGVASTFWLFGVCLIPAVLCLINIDDPKYVSKGRHKVNLRPLLKNKAFVLFILFTLIYYIAARPFYDMLTVYMQKLNMDTSSFGLLVSIRALCEVPSLIAMVALRKKVPLPYLVIANTILVAISGFLMGTVISSFPTLVLAQCATGVGNGLLIGSATNYINEIAPDELKATASSSITMASCFAGLVGNLGAGTMIELVGARPFYLYLGFWLIVATVLYLVSTRMCGVKFTKSK
jgi:predicted MFS family arabinose efflux permease